MKSLGLLGGTSWHSTIDYYRHINEMVNKRQGDKVNPPLVIYNLNQWEIHKLQEEDQWQKIAQIYVETGKKLVASGAQALMFCANTPHKCFDDVASDFTIPFIHIADATAEYAKAKNLKNLGLIGTKFTMEGNFISGRLKEKHGLNITVPKREVKLELHRIIIEELCHGDFSDRAKKYVIGEMDKLKEAGAEGIILGCTEFPILVNQKDYDLPLFDTSYLHAKSAVDFILS